MRGDHPTTGAGDFLLVEDTRRGVIASSLCLIAQRWSYAGVPFGVGRPEMVGTLPEYRRRGLVRAQFALLHAWSAARGEMALMIGGIPWYYRQFGYEMALELDAGRFCAPSDVPDYAGETHEPYRIRPATEADIPFLARAYDFGMGRGRIAVVRDPSQWRYELVGHSPSSDMRFDLFVIERTDGVPVGFFGHPPRLWRCGHLCAVYELASRRFVAARHSHRAASSPIHRRALCNGEWHTIQNDQLRYRLGASRLHGDAERLAWHAPLPMRGTSGSRTSGLPAAHRTRPRTTDCRFDPRRP